MENSLKAEIKLVKHLVNQLVLIWMVLSTVGVILIAMRAKGLVGFTSREYIYFTLYFVVLIIFIYRHRIKTKTKGVLFILFLFIMAFVGVFHFAFMAPSALFIPMISVLLALFYNARIVIGCSIIMLAMVALIGYGFQSKYLLLSIDANEMMISKDQWSLYLLGITFFVLFVSVAILKYKKTMLHLIEQITANKLAMEKLANYDELTGLPISQLAQVHFEEAVSDIKKHENIALMFLDLDKFKLINDTYGHDAGDLCLQHVANQARKVIKNGQIYRLGGDEFLIVVEKFENKNEALSVANDVILSIAKPLNYQNNVITVQVSVGIAIYKQNGEKFNELRRAADTAMYRAKQSFDVNICLI